MPVQIACWVTDKAPEQALCGQVYLELKNQEKWRGPLELQIGKCSNPLNVGGRINPFLTRRSGVLNECHWPLSFCTTSVGH